MWRSLFLAIGIMSIVLGAECLMIDSAALHAASSSAEVDYDVTGSGSSTAKTEHFQPSEWLPWSLMGVGTLTVLYALTLRRGGG